MQPPQFPKLELFKYDCISPIQPEQYISDLSQVSKSVLQPLSIIHQDSLPLEGLHSLHIVPPLQVPSDKIS